MIPINFKQSSHTDAIWVCASDLFRFARLEFLFTHSLIEIDYKNISSVWREERELLC